MSIAEKVTRAKADLDEVYEAGKSKGYREGTDFGFNWGYTDGYSNGEADGYNKGYEEGSANATPSTPTDNRTSLAYWYSYLQDNWGVYWDWDNYTELPFGEPLEELEYPTGTQNVTSVKNFLKIRTYQEDGGGYSGYKSDAVRVKKFTGVLDLPNVTEASSMFSSAKDLVDIGTIVFRKPLTNVSNMFYNCPSLSNVSITGFDTSKCTNFDSMFYSCSSMENLPSGLDTSIGENFSYMFAWCVKLVSIQSIDFSNAKTLTGVFYSCNNLEHIGVTGTISFALDLKSCTKLSHDTLVAIINALVKKTSGTWKLTIGSTNIAKLSQDEINIATSKGWQVV